MELLRLEDEHRAPFPNLLDLESHQRAAGRRRQLAVGDGSQERDAGQRLRGLRELDRIVPGDGALPRLHFQQAIPMFTALLGGRVRLTIVLATGLAVGMSAACGSGGGSIASTTPPQSTGSPGAGSGNPDGGTTTAQAADGGAAQPADAGITAWDITDFGPHSVWSLADDGRALGGFVSADGGVEVGVWDGHWSAALPLPDDAAYILPAGIDDAGHIAVNAIFRHLRGQYQRGYTIPPLTAVPTAAQVPQQNIINAINSRTGHLVGYDEAIGGAYLYANGITTPIAAQPGTDYLDGGASQAIAIDDTDTVVGWFRPHNQPLNSAQRHGFIWRNGTLTDLGGGSGDGGNCDLEALGINDSGLVMGMIDTGARCGVPHVFIYDGVVHDVGCPPGADVCWPFAMNQNGDIVGNSLQPGDLLEHAFLYTKGQFHMLEDLVHQEGWTFQQPSAINARGQIATTAQHDGKSTSVILTPR